ncbi:hypothetical protein HUT27_12915 [Pseudomonas chlororaphis]|uniref:hypothetical protein n=1 Tax=Pseudomonas chlororaphis TaxID=587753 RepID=UPI001B30906C|nr:hypothetical protein [Pseudomonas chlororaphis]MBP5064993.1 hypothetical protein [Pseudomonas chlororaphis]QTT94352.1 hypothetical protein HUT27_12915 [Pseudomonas chlororaphis]
MAFTEPNLHSRNLKLISMMFIVYWALGLAPAGDSIRLIFINYEITNPAALPWIAHTILLYFAWRFYLSSRNMIKHGFIKTINTNLSGKHGSLLYRLLEKRAREDYIKNQKDKFQKEREDYALEQGISTYNNIDFLTNPQELKYEYGELCLTYQAYYREPRLPGNDFRGYTIKYQWFHWLWFKTWKIFEFLTKKEETPDYLIPWVLFLCALLTSAFNILEITARNISLLS